MKIYKESNMQEGFQWILYKMKSTIITVHVSHDHSYFFLGQLVDHVAQTAWLVGK